MKDVKKIILEYEECAVLHWNASRKGDYRTANRNYAQLTQIYKKYLNNKELQEEILPQLLYAAEYCTQAWAAAHSLGLGIYQDEAVSILERISEMSESIAPSFEAKMTLKVWREQGKLTF